MILETTIKVTNTDTASENNSLEYISLLGKGNWGNKLPQFTMPLVIALPFGMLLWPAKAPVSYLCSGYTHE